MAIRLKSDFAKIIFKLIAVVLFGLFMFSVVNVAVFYKYVLADSYYKSDEFIDKVSELTSDLQQYYSNLNVDNDSNQENLKEWVNNYDRKLKDNIKSIEDEYSSKIALAQKNDDLKLVNTLKQEKKDKLSEAHKEHDSKVNGLKRSLKLNAADEYKQIDNKMKEWKILKYYLVSKKTGDVYTNIDGNANSINIKDYIKENSEYSVKVPIKYDGKNYKYYLQYKNISKILEENNMQCYFIVPKHTDGYNTYNAENIRFTYMRQKILKQAVLGVVFFVISIILSVIVSISRKEEDSTLGNLEKLYMLIPIEIRMLFILISSSIYLYATIKYDYMMQYDYLTPAYCIYIVITIIYSYFMLVNLKELYFMIKDTNILKAQYSKSIIGLTVQLIKDMVNYKDAAVKATVRFLSVFLVFISGFVIYYRMEGILEILAVLYLFAYFILMPVFTFRTTEYLSKIVEASRQMSQGNMNYTIDEGNRNKLLEELAHNINNIGEGYKKSLNDQMKSERMKTELITNVSHDLKTPLTSIINYVDLLKSGRLSDEELEGYISVIARKSERLKVLIEDLFEAAKMTSGTVQLNIERIDVTALLKQALAEFDEKIEKSSLIFRTNIPAGNIYLNLDGKKTWRVFENMINNILKYSQPDTRVYIELMELDESVKIIMKNIANYEMDFDVEEISERFKRGDKSRHTEGTGLGLAIAKSILDLEKGKLTISVDGDLFKAVVEFKK